MLFIFLWEWLGRCIYHGHIETLLVGSVSVEMVTSDDKQRDSRPEVGFHELKAPVFQIL